MAAKEAVATPQSNTKKKKHRSPAYPAINLAQAIKRAEEFYKHEGRNPASFNAAAAHWTYKPTSSGALLAAAALKSFGLMDEVESATGRTLQLSALGLKIVADKRPASPEREAAIKEAALKPKIHAAIWRKWNGTLPSDPELAYRLENEWKFNTNSIQTVIRELRDTISFAKLVASDNISVGDEDTQEDEPPIKVGDFIQWESQGMIQFVEPKRVTGFSEDGEYLFVEGSLTGIPVTEASVEEAPASAPKLPAVPPLASIRGARGAPGGGSHNVRQDVFSLSEGNVILSWPTPLSQNSIDEIKDWLKSVERRISRSVTEPRNYMEKKIAAGECQDVNDLGVNVRPGVFRLREFTKDSGRDYCDLASNDWIRSIGKNKQTGEILASTSAEFYQNPEYECLFLR
jgi:hypothetical protein